MGSGGDAQKKTQSGDERSEMNANGREYAKMENRLCDLTKNDKPETKQRMKYTWIERIAWRARTQCDPTRWKHVNKFKRTTRQQNEDVVDDYKIKNDERDERHRAAEGETGK